MRHIDKKSSSAVQAKKSEVCRIAAIVAANLGIREKHQKYLEKLYENRLMRLVTATSVLSESYLKNGSQENSEAPGSN